MPLIPITNVCRTVELTKRVMIQPFATLHMLGLFKVPFMAKEVCAMLEAEKEPFSDSVITVNNYTNEILPGLVPQVNKGEGTEMEQNPTEPGKLNPLFENFDLSGITD